MGGVRIVFVNGPAMAQAERMLCGVSLLERAVQTALDQGAAAIEITAPPEAHAALGPTVLRRLAAQPAPLHFAEPRAGANTPVAPDAPSPLIADRLLAIDITDAAAARRAEAALLRGCRRAYDGVADRFVIRYVSLALTKWLCRWPITPNQVTAANIVAGLMACAAAFRGVFWLAGALFFLQLVLDSCDGELARLTFQRSRAGMIADNIGDDVVDTLFTAALGWGLGGTWAWLGIAAAGVRTIYAVVVYVSLWRAGTPGDTMGFRWWFDAGGSTADTLTPSLRPLDMIRSIGRRDMYGLVWAVTAVTGLPRAGFVIGAAVAIVLGGLSVFHAILAPRAYGGNGSDHKQNA